jgi:hypothetical protein
MSAFSRTPSGRPRGGSGSGRRGGHDVPDEEEPGVANAEQPAHRQLLADDLDDYKLVMPAMAY